MWGKPSAAVPATALGPWGVGFDGKQFLRPLLRPSPQPCHIAIGIVEACRWVIFQPSDVRVNTRVRLPSTLGTLSR